MKCKNKMTTLVLMFQRKKFNDKLSGLFFSALLREGFNKKNIKSFGIFHRNVTPPTPSMKKTHFFQLCFKILSITQFSENFEEQTIICLILKDITIEVEVIKSDYQSENLT